MDLWIIQNGEKTGPIHDFEIRKKIEHGELPPDTPAWHEGLPAWKPLIEISLFEREFERPIEPPAPPFGSAADDSDRPVPPPLAAGAFVIRRFWARWFDLYLFAGVWWIGLWAAGRDIEAALSNPWALILLYVPWFMLESLLLQRCGTTPGKWLLGLKVVNDDGSLLSLAAAARRSARVLCLGLGFGWGVLTLVLQIMAFFTAKRLGRPLWDHSGGHRVTAAPLKPLHLVAYVLLLFAALQLQMIVVAPYVLEAAAKTFPALRAPLEQNPPWHLPPRH